MHKIILYTDTPIAGGAEKHLQLLAKYLQQNGHQVTVVCSIFKSLDEWCKKMRKDGITVIRLQVSHKHDPRHLVQLKSILKSSKPDILHLHLWNPGACRYAFWAKSLKNLKIIATEHDPFPLSNLKKSLKKSALKRTDHTIAVSEASKQQILSWYPELKGKITTIHNGIDLEQFEKELLHFSNQEKAKIRSQIFQAQPDDFVILTIAALHPRKGLLYLLEAFHELKERKKNLKLVMIGEGPQKKVLEKKIKKLKLTNDVFIIGHQENIPHLLKSGDLFVLPSKKEAFGLVLLEALAAQIPIVASNVGGIPEIIENGKNGVLVQPENSEDLAEKIFTFIKNEPLRQKMTFLGHHRVKEFDIKKMVEKTEKVYDQISPL